jgi:DNA mismatch endonuclease (patch repair protein)
LHATWPVTNADFWKAKIEGNRLRDVRNENVLAEAGWKVVRLWEHQPIEEMVRTTFAVVTDARIRSKHTDPAQAEA